MDIRHGFRFGEWEVLPLVGDLRRGDELIHLEPKVMEVLVVLAEHAETVVLRDELLDRVWGPRAAVSDEPLTRCIAQLRQALGDSSRDPRYIQTVPKRGYRLLQSVLPAAAQPEPAEEQLIPSAAAQVSGVRPLHGRWIFGSLGGLAILGILGILMMRGGDSFETGFEPTPCQIDPAEIAVPERAREQCERGRAFLDERSEYGIIRAIEHFKAAIAAHDRYGAALVNLARAMVLYPTYALFVDLEVCALEEEVSLPENCFDAALDLLERNQDMAPYIENFSHGIEGYVYTRSHMWNYARGAFEVALDEQSDDPDMWQWYSQFLAAVGDTQGALAAAERAAELAPDVPVIAFRLVVALMWVDDMDRAERLYYEAKERFVGANVYPDMELVFHIRTRNWQEVRRLLEQRAATSEQFRRGTDWIDPFMRWLESDRDEQYRAAAVLAAREAVRREELIGQHAYGIFVYLQQPALAINEARELLRSNPLELDVEFLFASETAFLWEHESFPALIEQAGLSEYWSRDPDNCPPHFDEDARSAYCA